MKTEFYFTGKPCKHGHISKRYVKTKICFECNRLHYLDIKKNKVLKESKLKESLENKRLIDRKYYNEKRSIQVEKLLYKNAKRRAKDKGLEFTIESSDIVVPEICPVLGIPLNKNRGGRSHMSTSPSIDRVDSNKGYTKDNIQVISHRANNLKNNATLEELRKLVTYVEKFQNSR